MDIIEFERRIDEILWNRIQCSIADLGDADTAGMLAAHLSPSGAASDIMRGAGGMLGGW